MFSALKRKRSVVFTDPSDESHSANCTPVYRNSKSPRALTERPGKNINTIYDICLRGFNDSPTKEMFGQRKIVNIIEEEKEVTKKVPGGGEVKEIKKWKFFELSPYEWYTWSQAEEKVHNYSSGYRALGLNKGDKVTIYADTSRDWMLTAMACMEQSITITTAYATLGEEGLTYSLQECEVTTLFTNADLLPMLLKVTVVCPKVKNIVYNGKADAETLKKLQAKMSNVLSLEELEALGNQKIYAPVPPKAEDLALIMYTSGSTGTPKGVMLTHANVVASVSGSVKNYCDPINGELYLGYLPLAHILEFAAEMAHLFMGTRIGYGSVKTLTDASVRNCKGDIRELRPTLFAGVPAVWEGIRKAVLGKVQNSSPVAQAIFNGAFYMKSVMLDYGLDAFTYPLDALVFNKIKDQVGGRVKFSLSGGAPMPKSTQKFMSVCNAPLVSGYGMTECTAVLALQEVSESAIVGMTGAPVTCLEVKLVDVENTSYKSTNLPKPQGEVWVRGPAVMKGYYKQEQLTRETITEDGWLMTGDIAEMNQDGTLSIIDRKKNLVKLSNGEYIALEKLEANYKVSKYVQNICVHADSEQAYAIAFIQPIEKEIRALAAERNIHPGVDVDHLDYEALCARKDIREQVLNSLKDIAKKVGFKPAEVVGQVYLTPEEWTPQNEMLTAAMKLQRKVIVNKYKAEIVKMYSQ